MTSPIITEDNSKSKHALRSRAPDPIKQIMDAVVFLAPMSGVTDVPFRILMRRYGCKFAFTEMLDSNGINYNNARTLRMLDHPKEDEPLGVQIMGQEADTLIMSAKLCQDKGYPMLDFNAGCPAKKIVSPGKGASLLKDPLKLGRLVGALVKELSIPVTVKIRSGWSEKTKNYLEIAKIIESEGASAICIHPRTRDQKFKGKPDHEITREIKENVNIPIFASGNVFSLEDVMDLKKKTNCDAVVLARGALGKPWIFNDIYNGVLTDTQAPQERFEKAKKAMKEHFDLCFEFMRPRWKFSQMYKHVSWYFVDFKNLNEIMREFLKVKSIDEFTLFLQRLSLDPTNKLYLQ
ncbi:tRNA dihydrouridine synthase DusB [Elusimicrobiota bacterium]